MTLYSFFSLVAQSNVCLFTILSCPFCHQLTKSGNLFQFPSTPPSFITSFEYKVFETVFLRIIFPDILKYLLILITSVYFQVYFELPRCSRVLFMVFSPSVCRTTYLSFYVSSTSGKQLFCHPRIGSKHNNTTNDPVFLIKYPCNLIIWLVSEKPIVQYSDMCYTFHLLLLRYIDIILGLLDSWKLTRLWWARYWELQTTTTDNSSDKTVYYNIRLQILFNEIS